MRLLPVADDCGMTKGVTETILRCMDAGGIHGTSVVTGGDYAHDGAKALGRRIVHAPHLRAGVHLNLLEGRCTAPPSEVPLLVDEKGLFRHNLLSLWKTLTISSGKEKEILLEQVEREFRAQFDTVFAAVREGMREEAAGKHPADALVKELFPTLYLDGHLHVHALPPLRPVLESLLAHYPVAHVRIPAETRYVPPSSLLLCVTGTMRRELLAFWSGPLRMMLQKLGVTFPDYFIGAFCSGCMTMMRLQAGLENVARHAKNSDAMVEVMFHPGGFSPAEQMTFCDATKGEKCVPAYASFYASACRGEEAALLLSDEYQNLMRRYDQNWTTPALHSP